MAKRNAKPNPKRPLSPDGTQLRGDVASVTGLRIIGGSLRGRKLEYTGDLRTRPMKDRVREAIFNLIGPAVRQKHALDLFAGTGALGLEAISRGAAKATLIEQHYPTANLIRKNAEALGVAASVEVVPANVFIWVRRGLMPAGLPWMVFCSPPYDFYVQRAAEMQEMLERLMESAAPGSIFVTEADERFDFGTLPMPGAWDVRAYLPAVVGIYRKE